MSDNTGIEWTDATWNPVSGCTKVSTGCDHCYAETLANRFAGTKAFPNGFEVTLRPERLDWPLRKRKPLRIFVNSMSDLFHDDVPDEYIAKVFAIMALAPRHTFQVLTKRHARMRSLLNSARFQQVVLAEQYRQRYDDQRVALTWPLPSVWLGVSTENQQWADIRIPALLDTPAAVRFVSAEPLLGPIKLRDEWLEWGNGRRAEQGERGLSGSGVRGALDRPTGADLATCGEARQSLGNGHDLDPMRAPLAWVITGGESGPGARPAHPQWFRSLRDQCQAAGVAFLFKQHGDWLGQASRADVPRDPDAWVNRDTGAVADEATAIADGGDWRGVWRVGKKRAGRLLDNRTWDEYPGGR